MENIQVAIRVRPLSEKENQTNEIEIWNAPNQNTIAVPVDRFNEALLKKKINPSQKLSFTYNYCFDKRSSTQDVYNSLVKRIALSSLEGINGTVFMYGQTGSGKTFTMMGGLNTNNNIISIASQISPRKVLNECLSPSQSTQANTLKDLYSENGIKKKSSYQDLEFNKASNTPTRGRRREKNLEYNLKQPVFQNIKKAHLLKHANSVRINLMSSFEDEKILASDGILLMALKDIFQEIERSKDREYFLRCSYIEIYTDTIFDLLKPQHQLHETLTIFEDSSKEFVVKNANEEIVSSIEEIMQKIKVGERNRHYANTIMNHTSSRSHTIFRLYVQSIPTNISKGENVMTESILNFVDLAGSEKISIHDVGKRKGPGPEQNLLFKDRVNESKHINKSLFFLTQVISLKSQGKADSFIPYRNSPLTKILRSSLGGNSRTAIILCINPCLTEIEHSLGTLRFGLNAKKIENKVSANLVLQQNDQTLQRLIQDYEKKILDMEREKDANKNISEELLKVIEKLQDQKNLLSDRLALAKHNGFDHNFIKNLLKNKKASELTWEHFHYKDVGILQVLVNKEENIENQLKFDCEGKYALKGLMNIRQQNNILEYKVSLLSDKLDESERVKQEAVNRCIDFEKKLQKKKAKAERINTKLAFYTKENEKLHQIIKLYQNKHPEGLKKLSDDALRRLEKSISSLQETLRSEKALRALTVEILHNSNFPHSGSSFLERQHPTLVTGLSNQDSSTGEAFRRVDCSVHTTDSSFLEEFYLNEIDRQYPLDPKLRWVVPDDFVLNKQNLLMEGENKLHANEILYTKAQGGNTRSSFNKYLSGNTLSNELAPVVGVELSRPISIDEQASNMIFNPSEPFSKNFESFENYFSIVYNKEKEKLMGDGELGDLDRKLSQLRLNLDEILSQKLIDGKNILLDDEYTNVPGKNIEDHLIVQEEYIQNFNDLFCNENPLKENAVPGNAPQSPAVLAQVPPEQVPQDAFSVIFRNPSSSSTSLCSNMYQIKPTPSVAQTKSGKEGIFDDDDDEMSFQNELMKSKYFSGNKKKIIPQKELIGSTEDFSNVKVQDYLKSLMRK